MTGGGSGGHITPLLAVAAEIKSVSPHTRIIYIGQKTDRFAAGIADSGLVDETKLISAGKFRRYHGEGWRQLLDVGTWLLNVRDFFRFIAGIGQSLVLIRRLNPQVIFIKGGFVGVPVGLAAALLRVPYITHDSDSIPGLANRIIKRWASIHTVALPKGEYKSYPSDATITVGVPVQASYQAVSALMQKKAKITTKLTHYDQVLMITGGGLGAERLNNLMIKVAPQILADFPKLAVVHLAGARQQSDVQIAYRHILENDDLDRVKVLGFVGNLYDYSAASDVIITRAGATSLAEFGHQGKACIVVPSAQLTGGHQLKNAQILQENNAAVVMTDEIEQHVYFAEAIVDLLRDGLKREQLSKNLHNLIPPDASNKLASILLSFDGRRKKSE